LATNRRANDKADCDEDGCIFYLSVASTKSLFCLFCEKTEEEKSRARLKSATRNALFSARSPEPLSVVPLSLSLSRCCFQRTSLGFFTCGGKQQRRHNTEDAKKLNKAESTNRNCSESALFSLCCFLSCAFSTPKQYSSIRDYFIGPWRSPPESQQRTVLPHYSTTRFTTRWRLRKPFTSKRSSAT